jgi:hypothetical protein
VRHSDKKTWSLPDIDLFDDPDEVWDLYKSRGTPEQRARLKAMLDFAREQTVAAKRRSA